MIKTYKVMLHPNKVQNTRLFQFAGSARYAYNWAITQQKAAYEADNTFISESTLRKQFTQHKRTPGNEWMYTISNDVFKQSVKDCCLAYQRFFKKKAKYPRYKRRKGNQSFYQDPIKLQFTETHVRIEMLSSQKKRKHNCWVKLAETGRIPTGVKYYNPRMTYDGLHWWVSVGVESIRQPIVMEYTESIGIDLGVKDLAICSDGVVYKNINKISRIKKLEKKKRRLQRRISKKYEMNKEENRYKKTCNIIKSEKRLKRNYQRLTGIRQNYIHQITSEIIGRKPRQITMEDLNIMGMMKNKHLSKHIQDCCWGLFKQLVEYKASMLNILVVFADRFYPSSKRCSNCGHIKTDLKLSDRTYVCEYCGMTLNRDLNAAINLKKYGETY